MPKFNDTTIYGDLTVNGTIRGNYDTGDILYVSDANTITGLPKGINGQVLKLVNGLPAWRNDTTYEVFSNVSNGLVPAPYETGSTKFLRQDGSWVVPTNTNTTYSQSWAGSGTNAILRLTAGGSGSGNDDLTLVAGENITLTPSGDNLTIDAAHNHEANDITDFTAEVLAISPPWKLISSTQIVIPTTLTANNVTVVSGNYYNKILAFEVRVVTGTDSFETHVVFGRMGIDSTTLVSATYDRLFSWSTFDGQYFKTHSFKAYVPNSTTSTMTVGHTKHLIGNFSGASIEWTTNTTTSIYLERIWLVN